MGIEPTVFGSGHRRLAHLATGTCVPEVGFEPTRTICPADLKSAPLDLSGIQAQARPVPRSLAPSRKQGPAIKKKSKWSIRVSIPVPRACKARTLPIELMPLRLPGIEPGSSAWEAPMITITLQALESTPGGDRTRDPRLIRPVLYR